MTSNALRSLARMAARVRWTSWSRRFGVEAPTRAAKSRRSMRNQWKGRRTQRSTLNSAMMAMMTVGSRGMAMKSRKNKMCEHKDFEANVVVNRLEDIGRFAADVTIRCKECSLPFQFVGLPVGLNLDGATVSLDATEARLAIVPRGEAPTVLGSFPRGFKVSAFSFDETNS